MGNKPSASSPPLSGADSQVAQNETVKPSNKSALSERSQSTSAIKPKQRSYRTIFSKQKKTSSASSSDPQKKKSSSSSSSSASRSGRLSLDVPSPTQASAELATKSKNRLSLDVDAVRRHARQEMGSYAKESATSMPTMTGNKSLANGVKFTVQDLGQVQLKKAASAHSPTCESPDYMREKQRKIDKLEHDSKRASKITPFLYLSGDLVARNYELLRDTGITHVLNTAHTVCRNYHENKQGSFEYLSFNLIDSSRESISCFILQSIMFIETARKANGACFVHCHQGVSRSSTLVIAYLMWYNKWKFKQAFDYVKDCRKVCSPNQGFVYQLFAWEDRLQEQSPKPTLMRIARHSHNDSTLVAKPCVACEQTQEIGLLDDRGAFVLRVPGEALLIIWVGPKCADPPRYLESAFQIAHWMVAILPQFTIASVVCINKDMASSPVNRKFQTQDSWKESLEPSSGDGGSPSTTSTYSSNSEVAERARQIFCATLDLSNLEDLGTPERQVSAYDAEYDAATVEAPSPSHAPDVKKLSLAHPGHSTKHLATNGGDPVSPKLSSQHDASTIVDEDETLFVQMYQCFDGMEFERVKEYDVSDLLPETFLVVLAHDSKLVEPSRQADLSLRTSMFHVVYLWFGSQLENLVNQEAAKEIATDFVQTMLVTNPIPIDQVKICCVVEGHETDEFWEAFEAGY